MRTALSPWTNEWFREIDGFFESPFKPVIAKEAESVWFPKVDVDETDKDFKFSLDIPGTPKEGIKVEFQDGKLHISGERNLEDEKKEGDRRIYERQRGKFERTFLLGKDVDADKVEASYKDGVLFVTVPKAEHKKPKLIEIKGIH